MKICPRKCIPSEIVIVVIENANINSVERSTVSISHRELVLYMYILHVTACYYSYCACSWWLLCMLVRDVFCYKKKLDFRVYEAVLLFAGTQQMATKIDFFYK